MYSIAAYKMLCLRADFIQSFVFYFWRKKQLGNNTKEIISFFFCCSLVLPVGLREYVKLHSRLCVYVCVGVCLHDTLSK